jgi:gluconokinase
MSNRPGNLFVNDSDLILALDVGTSSTKTALFDAQGNRLLKTTAQKTYALRVTHDGAAELAVSDLEKAVISAIRDTLLAHQRDRRLRNRPIIAVGMSCFWHSLLGYDPRRQQPTPIYTWADARCREDAQKLRTQTRESACVARTGCMLRTPYWPAKLRWLARTKAAPGVTMWMSPAEWLYARLCGDFAMSTSMASGTGLLNLRTNQWDPAALRLAKVHPNFLPKISDEPLHAAKNPIPLGNSIRPIRPNFLALKGALWYPAIGDGAASNLGSDAVRPHTAALNVGTSAALRLVEPKVPTRLVPGLFCYRVDRDRCLLGGAISNAGNLRAWALQQLRLPDNPAALERALADRMLPKCGLTVLPFWTGERSPTWPEGVGGTITGLTYATTALDLLQALIEATYHRLAQIADLLERQDGHPLNIVVSGGIRHSPESLQRLANVLGRTIRTCAEPEASLRGAAVNVLQRMGQKVKSLQAGRAIRPKAFAAALYVQMRAAQIALEEKTTIRGKSILV